MTSRPLAIMVALLLTLSLGSPSDGQTSSALADFLSNVDADGDGTSTYGDTQLVQWWVDSGGTHLQLMENAVIVGDLWDISLYLSQNTTGLPTVPTSVPRGPGPCLFSRGDANEDGTLNIADANFILAALFSGGAAPSNPDSADVDDNGNTDISDPVYLMNYLFQSGVPPAPPFPGYGFDPTLDPVNSNCNNIPHILDMSLVTVGVGPNSVTVSVSPGAVSAGFAGFGIRDHAGHPGLLYTAGLNSVTQYQWDGTQGYIEMSGTSDNHLSIEFFCNDPALLQQAPLLPVASVPPPCNLQFVDDNPDCWGPCPDVPGSSIPPGPAPRDGNDPVQQFAVECSFRIVEVVDENGQVIVTARSCVCDPSIGAWGEAGQSNSDLSGDEWIPVTTSCRMIALETPGTGGADPTIDRHCDDRSCEDGSHMCGDGNGGPVVETDFHEVPVGEQSALIEVSIYTCPCLDS